MDFGGAEGGSRQFPSACKERLGLEFEWNLRKVVMRRILFVGSYASILGLKGDALAR
jgi:hypothetical protein